MMENPNVTRFKTVKPSSVTTITGTYSHASKSGPEGATEVERPPYVPKSTEKGRMGLENLVNTL